MRADEKGWGITLSSKCSDEIHKLDFPARSVVRENLTCYFPSERFELFYEIRSGLFDRLRPGRARTQVHHRLNMRERFFAREFLPNFLLSTALWLRLRLRPIASAKKAEREKQSSESYGHKRGSRGPPAMTE